MKSVKHLNIVKKLSYQQYIDSDYPQHECENFGYEHLMDKELERWMKYQPQVFVTTEDKEHNYGLDFKIYLRYKSDGFYHFRSISFGSSCISNASFRAISSPSFVMSEDEFDSYIKGMSHLDNPTDLKYFMVNGSDDRYANDNKTRKYFRDCDWMTSTTEF